MAPAPSPAQPQTPRSDYRAGHQDDADVFQAALALVRAIGASAHAVYRLGRTGAAEASYPIVRSMLELWAEYRYLMQAGDRAERVHQIWVFGALTLERFQQPPPRFVQEATADMQRRYPAAYQAAEARFRTRPTGHWSGIGRKSLVTQMCGPDFGRLYEFLSWDVHPVIQSLLDATVAMRAGGPSLRIAHRVPQAQVAEETCRTALNIVFDVWNHFASHFAPIAVRPQSRQRSASTPRR